MDLWVTGGGTREPIDAVRYLGNRSTGRLASELVREGIRRGHRVTAFLAEAVPALAPAGSLEVLRFETARELSRQLELQPGPAPQAVLHAAAVADYAPDPLPGKVPSGKESWTLVLKRLPKVIDVLRRRFPDSVLVMFKLESDVGVEELKERARSASARAGADLVFANRLQDVGEDHRGTLIWSASGQEEQLCGRGEVASGLLRAVEVVASSRSAGLHLGETGER